MRSFFLSLITMAILSAFHQTPLNAQSLMERVAKRAAEKLEQKTEDRIDQKVDEGIDKSLDDIEESATTNKEENASPDRNSEAANQKRMENLLGKMGISSEPVNYADAYTFNSSMRINIKTVNKKGKVVNDGDMVSYLSDDDKCMAYEFVSGDINVEVENAPKNKGLFIIDYDNKATLILSEDNNQKTGVAYGLSEDFGKSLSGEAEDDVYEESTGEDLDYTPANLKKTGRTKDILGYKCEEYEYTDENTRGSFWLTKDYESPRSTALPSMFNWTAVTFGRTSGFLMASESTDLQSGEKSTMEVTEINPNKNTSFHTKQYEITNLGSIGMAGN
ncbi:DUF4412 domain-containing protein [Geofilum rubicundum]|uniref:DUF4412 domain-containing protein n=1 Tax=Geofilum rubicundum JCM 15548 TaxID=1236989 RepID=A0A0E9M1U7_9BACT|nr:DUF4412 domain-containing protein [Geofilum rubicundum]GAO31543.1 hypothetical protein JCM15548_13914 [Geofilum rubicundum JCM 15548]